MLRWKKSRNLRTELEARLAGIDLGILGFGNPTFLEDYSIDFIVK
jgi:hypothetical protein